MDLEFPMWLTTLSLLVFFIFKIVTVAIKTATGQKLPPGPPKLPLIGNLHQLLSISSLPHRAMTLLSRKHGPIMHLQIGEISTVVVSSPEMAREVMKTHHLALANRPQVLTSKIIGYNGQGIIFSPYGDYWRQMRKICTLEVLSAKTVRSFAYIREEEVSELVELARSTSGSPFNISEKMSLMGSAVIARAALGKRCEHQEVLLPMIKESVSQLTGLFVSDLFPSVTILPFLSGAKAKLEKIHRKIDSVLDDIIKQHRENLASSGKGNGELGEKDFLDVLLQLQDGDGLEFPITDNNIKAVILDVFIAGTGSAASVVEWTMSQLIRTPRVMEKVQAEVRECLKGKKAIREIDIQGLSYLKYVIKETLRLHPPGPLLMPRECIEACEIDGYVIPKKTRVFVNYWAIGRDPEYWKDAEQFIPERFEDTSFDFNGADFQFMPFGAGRRICPGINFSLANIELPLAQLLFHFDWKLPHGRKPEDLDMTEIFGTAAARKKNLVAIATPYMPCHD